MTHKVLLIDSVLIAHNAPAIEIAAYRWRWLAALHVAFWNSTGMRGTHAFVESDNG